MSVLLAYALFWCTLHPLVPHVPPRVAIAADSAALRYDVPAALLLAVAKTESHFHRHAVSPAGAEGLMQIMPGTAHALHVVDVFSVRQSMNGAARYLRHFLLTTQHAIPIRDAVFAYNTGHTGSRWQVEHSGYVQAVYWNYHAILREEG